MDEESVSIKPDLTLGYLGKQDLYALSVGDLEERIEALKTEIKRCEETLSARGSTRDAAEKLFKS